MTHQDIDHIAKQITPIFIFDVNEGQAQSVTDSTDFDCPAGATYRWLHLDLDDPALTDWAMTNLSPTAAASLYQSETRPRCDTCNGGIILNLRAINMNEGASGDDMVSLRMWIQGSSIVSVRRRKVFAVDALRAQCEANNAPESIGAFLIALTEGLTDRMETVSLDLEAATDAFEDKVLSGDFNFGLSLTEARSSAAKLRRYIGPQREALNRLAGLEIPLIPSEYKIALRETANRVTRIVEELDSVRERLKVIDDSAEGQRGADMSQNGYVLSIVAAIFLPLGFLTGLLGVNVAGIPGTEWRYSFLVVCIVMVVIGIGLGLLFKKLKWI